jgi:IS605 OrfB family transposase
LIPSESSPTTCSPSSPFSWREVTDAVRPPIVASAPKPPRPQSANALKKQQEKQAAKEAKKQAKAKEKEAKRAAQEAANPNKKRKRASTTLKEPKPKKVKGPPIKRARTALLDLDPRQRARLRQWFGVFRWTYNRCVATWREKGDCDLDALRERFVNLDSEEIEDWVRAVPSNLRYEAVREFKKALTACFSRQQNERAKGNTEWTFEMRFRSRKSHAESFPLLSKYYKNGLPYGSCWKDELGALPRIASRKHDVPELLDNDGKIVRKRDRFYVAVALPLPPDRTGLPTSKKAKTRTSWLENQEPKEEPLLPLPIEKVVAIDPGVRTFATMYDPAGRLVEWGAGDITRLFRLCMHADRLNTLSQPPPKNDRHSASTTHKQRKRIKRAFLRLHDRIKNLVTEFHRKLVKWLCENYNLILLPKFGTSQMVKRAERRINGKAARQILTWSHYQFRQRLESKALEYPWVRVVEVREDYTSKTCGRCGWINDKLGGSKKFSCRECKWTTDRDLNGARNIMLRTLQGESKRAHPDTQCSQKNKPEGHLDVRPTAALCHLLLERRGFDAQ